MYKRTPVDKPIEHLINSYRLLIIEQTLGVKTTNHCSGNAILWRLSVCLYVCLFVPLSMSVSLYPPPLSVCLSVCLSFPTISSLHRRVVKIIFPDTTLTTDRKLKQMRKMRLHKQSEYNKCFFVYIVLNSAVPQYVSNLYTHPPSRYSPVCI